MGQRLNWLLFRRSLRHWQSEADQAPERPLDQLRRITDAARQLRRPLDRLINAAEGRLALPLIGTSTIARPHGTDWSWRPTLWREPLTQPGLSSVSSKARLGDEVKVFHDCGASELTLRQLRNSRESDVAPFGLRMDVFKFDGSFLSLVIDLPPKAAAGLTKQHILRISSIVEIEQPLQIFTRLNIKHGPNTEQMVRELPLDAEDIMVEFDLAYSTLNEKRIEKIWVDLIFEAPDMNQVVLRDLTFLRMPRAAL